MVIYFRYYPSIDGNFGGLVDPKKYIFNGMVGMIQRKVNNSFIIGKSNVVEPLHYQLLN